MNIHLKIIFAQILWMDLASIQKTFLNFSQKNKYALSSN